MVPDRHFGIRSRSKLNHCQIGNPGRHWIRTVNSCTARWYDPNPSELGGLSVGRPAGPSIDSYKALVFAVCQYYLIKVAFSTTNNTFLHALQFAISINVESVFYFWYIVLSLIRGDKNYLMSAKICAMPWLPNMQELKLMTLHWCPFSGCGSEHVPDVFASKGCQYLINGCLQPSGT